MRALAVGLAIAILVFVLTSGHLIFLPLLFVPLGFFSIRRPDFGAHGSGSWLRALALGLAIAVLVFLVTAGHVIFLPLLFVPLGFLWFGSGSREGFRDEAAGPPARRRPE